MSAAKRFEVKSSGIGHGKGAFATVDIAAGTVVLVEKALWDVSVKSQDVRSILVARKLEAMGRRVETEQQGRQINAALDQMWRDEVVSELKRHKSDRGEVQHAALMDKLLALSPWAQENERKAFADVYSRAAACVQNNNFYSNSTGERWESRDLHLVFATASRFQHSCACNLETHCTQQTFIAIATTLIPKGAELFIDYCEAGSVSERSARQAVILKKRGFNCACRRCISDQRMLATTLWSQVLVIWALVRVVMVLTVRAWMGRRRESGGTGSASSRSSEQRQMRRARGRN